MTSSLRSKFHFSLRFYFSYFLVEKVAIGIDSSNEKSLSECQHVTFNKKSFIKMLFGFYHN